MRKDKKQVIGEEISDDSIKLFLAVEPADATPPSLHKLVKAYRGLRVDDFERFVGFFVAEGYDLSATDAQGHDFIALIQDQRNAEPYIDVIKAARG
ncbi:PA4642 family protein [Pseudomonas sp.]|uniref:PA4642 family protein n=1 Tax=Pseudomonas sp. TaxID=306 RepID=UPI003A96E8C8